MARSDASRRLRWHLLVHSLPARPLYLRARIRNRLERAGAAALKDSVYALPPREGCLEELRSISREADAGGGSAHVCTAEFDDALSDAFLTDLLRAARESDYAALERDVEALGRVPPRPREIARARRRFEAIVRLDWFDAPGRARVERLLAREEERARRSGRGGRSGGQRRFRGRVWVTRPGVQVDRIASAWLIRRRLDPEARFRFADPKAERRPGEIWFDVVGGDFTHEEDRCTFETLLRLVPAPEAALREVAEIVHEVDIKDGKFPRADVPGVAQVILGIVTGSPDDEERLRRGFALFDDLLASFHRKTAGAAGT